MAGRTGVLPKIQFASLDAQYGDQEGHQLLQEDLRKLIYLISGTGIDAKYIAPALSALITDMGGQLLDMNPDRVVFQVDCPSDRFALQADCMPSRIVYQHDLEPERIVLQVDSQPDNTVYHSEIYGPESPLKQAVLGFQVLSHVNPTSAYRVAGTKVVDFDVLPTTQTFRWNQVNVPAGPNTVDVRLRNLTDGTDLGSLLAFTGTGLKSFTVTPPTGVKLVQLQHRISGGTNSEIEGGVLYAT